MLKGIIIGSLALSLIAPSAKAADTDAAAKLAAAKSLYEQREDIAKNDEAIKTADLALAAAESKDLKYQILIFKSRAQFWKGWNTTVRKADGSEDSDATEKARKSVFKSAVEVAETATGVAPEYADSYYLAALNYARWGKVESNPLKRLENLSKLNKAVEKGKTLKSIDGTPGEAVDGYGLDRTHGAVYGSEKNPKRNTELSLSELNRAFEKAPTYAANQLYLAITYFTIFKDSKDAKKKQRGCDLLEELLSKDESEFESSRVPETKLELKEAAALQTEEKCS